MHPSSTMAVTEEQQKFVIKCLYDLDQKRDLKLSMSTLRQLAKDMNVTVPPSSATETATTAESGVDKFAGIKAKLIEWHEQLRGINVDTAQVDDADKEKMELLKEYLRKSNVAGKTKLCYTFMAGEILKDFKKQKKKITGKSFDAFCKEDLLMGRTAAYEHIALFTICDPVKRFLLVVNSSRKELIATVKQANTLFTEVAAGNVKNAHVAWTMESWTMSLAQYKRIAEPKVQT